MLDSCIYYPVPSNTNRNKISIIRFRFFLNQKFELLYRFWKIFSIGGGASRSPNIY